MRESIWALNDTPRFQPLTSDESADIAVVGAGMAGLLTAYMLAKRNAGKIILIDNNQPGRATTARTTAKITSQHGAFYEKLIRGVGKENAQKYAFANEQAIDGYEQLIHEHHIDCDFCRLPATVYTTDEKNAEKIAGEVEAARSLGLHAHEVHELCLPFDIVTADCFENQAQFHPLKFFDAILDSLCRLDVRIVGETHAIGIDDDAVMTEHGRVHAKSIVIATHFPISDLRGMYPLKMYQSRTYLMALKNGTDVKGMHLDYESDGYTLRNAVYDGQPIFLFGGASHKTGHEGDIPHYQKLEKAAKKYFPDSEILSAWSTQDCMTYDGIPYIGRYSPSKPHLYVATGFNKWGMSSSLIAANLLSDLITVGKSEMESVFSPHRSDILAQAGGFMVQMGDTVVNLAKHLVSDNPTCTHMGCTVSWNEDEQTYDCPCHGSRFSKDGSILDNPTVEPLHLD